MEARKQRTAELRTANNLKKQYQRSERTVYLIYYSYPSIAKLILKAALLILKMD